MILIIIIFGVWSRWRAMGWPEDEWKIEKILIIYEFNFTFIRFSELYCCSPKAFVVHTYICDGGFPNEYDSHHS